MIKTTELMLGNIIEYKNAYVQVINLAYGDLMIRHNGVGVAVVESDINPIPLTEGVVKRLNLALAEEENVHELQNYRTICGCNPIDITPLLSPRYTTHDGVEVWDGDEVWYTFTNPSSEATPQRFIAGVDVCNNRYVFFSSQQACQSYIDSLTRKPVFTTEDGVDVFMGDEYWFVERNGIISLKDKDIPHYTYCMKYSGNLSNYAYFSTKQLAEKYLNRTWLKADAEKAEAEYQSPLNTKK